jgi:FdhD protein
MSERIATKTPNKHSLSDVEPAIRSRVRKLTAGGANERTEDDWIASEAPLEVRIGGKPTTVLMRTPGHDEELVRGFLYSEGIVTSAADIVSVGGVKASAEDVGGSIISVELAPTRKGRTIDRSFYSNASCGVCGKKTIASLEVRGPIARTNLKIKRSILERLPDQLRQAQTTFAKTGGVHASGLFTTEGELIVLREDVGRHNALDKIIGWGMTAGKLPFSDCILMVSGRVSYEIVQKAVVAAIPFIAAVGAPSSLAVELAERFELTLAGFMKPGSLNVYAHPERIEEQGS